IEVGTVTARVMARIARAGRGRDGRRCDLSFRRALAGGGVQGGGRRQSPDQLRGARADEHIYAEPDRLMASRDVADNSDGRGAGRIVDARSGFVWLVHLLAN